ncbi:hypothetical protein OU5_P0139 (plasmid) [Pseudomonas mandelii JR-1]|uniref:Uncharacterized protein n=1 Tax=Pseudomonas mandelii JR-1 TaxID=1147786 RepID=A0A024EL98_9PSED|nr:hypothetical protein OU5_P0139 [Pseudomonas mandelii JR-1]
MDFIWVASDEFLVAPLNPHQEMILGAELKARCNSTAHTLSETLGQHYSCVRLTFSS